MRNRVSNLALAIFLSVVIIASGCAGDSTEQPIGAENPEDPNNTVQTGNDDQSNSDAEAKANLSLVSFTAPDEVQLDTNFTFEAKVKNTGGKSGKFNATLVGRESDSESFSSLGFNMAGEVPANEEITFEKSLSANGISTMEVKLLGSEKSETIRIVPKKLSTGEEYVTANDIGITVQSVELKESYIYEGYMGERQVNEPDSGKYAFVNIKSQNQGELSQSLPFDMDFQLIADNRQYESTYLVYEPINQGQAYEGGEVQPSIIRDGYIAFNVPSDVQKEDISVVWNEIISMSEKSVYWSP